MFQKIVDWPRDLNSRQTTSHDELDISCLFFLKKGDICLKTAQLSLQSSLRYS